MPSLRYLHLDVFTSTRFEGNQLAVFPDPPDLPAALMQRIAAEMAFSESTFVYPSTGTGDVRMRIFTPAEELPMAGHPTIGSTFALALEGTIAPGRDQFVFELGVGPTPVDLQWNDRALSFAWMTQGKPSFGGAVDDRAALAAGLGVNAADLDAELPAQIVSCGVRFLVVPLRTRAAVDACVLDTRGYAAALGAAGLDVLPVYLFSTEAAADGATAYSRMLAPMFGIAEDPATGSACGPLGCYLRHHGVVDAAAARRITCRQGVAMGRPSLMHADIESDEAGITRVRVGGEAVLAGRGTLEI
jgi:trans-2,3-dihydro-3-hydroxyanthranilate isomerase